MTSFGQNHNMRIIAILIIFLVHGSRSVSSQEKSDVLVIGAGIAGLSAAFELGTAGVKTTVIDIASVFGGHAVMSQGGLAIVDTPTQREQGIKDSPELAKRDFHTWGEDPNGDWVDYYCDHSRRDIYDWLVSLGVRFESALPAPGNSVARMHQPIGRGLGLVTPIYQRCLELPNVRFLWNTRAVSLSVDADRVVGARVRDERTGDEYSVQARAVVLATGGFQSNLDMVREYWPKNFRFPERILVGSGINSLGSGHRLAQRTGAALVHMDRQWNYFTGIPDIRYPGTNRGLSAANMYGILVNAEGRRFANLLNWTKEVMPRMLEQEQASLWFIFDAASKHRFVVSGSDWADPHKVESLILDNPQLVSKANSIDELATLAGLPAENLVATILRYNTLVDRGEDVDFGRFKPHDTEARQMSPKISQPPFYAMRAFPLTRKSMGGVAIDRACRVLDKDQRPISGLYAVGELTGLALINGQAALEGTFLGPCIVTGRVCGQEIAKSLAPSSTLKSNTATESISCAQCHNLNQLLSRPRAGFWHFEKVHARFKPGADQHQDDSQCARCHQELSPYRLDRHKTDSRSLSQTCIECHIAKE